MTHQDIEAKCLVVYSFLSRKQLKDAFDKLQNLLLEHNLERFSHQLEGLQTTYKFMLQYTVDSANDPEREKIYNKLFTDTYQLCDIIKEDLLAKYSYQQPYSFLRTHPVPSTETCLSTFNKAKKEYEMALLAEGEAVPYSLTNAYQVNIGEAFSSLWVKDIYTDNISNSLLKYIKEGAFKDYELSMLTSACSLSLWRHFDTAKFDLLFELASHPSELVKQRAIVGLLIALYIYDTRLPLFSGIQARLGVLAEQKDFIKALETIIIQFIRSKESEKIARRFNEEIIPEMVKLSPQMRDKLNFNKSETNEDEDDMNPDWQEMLDEVPGLTDKMKEISNMQMEGADVFLSTFSMLKSFPFFSHLHNWLIPFNPNYPEVAEETKDEDNKSFINTIMDSHFLCNSDKYSFLLSLQQMPSSQKQQMSSAMGAEFEGMKDIQKDKEALNNRSKSEFISNQYVQDLYRLFNLHPRKNDFHNIFDKELDFHNKNSIVKLIDDPKIWRNIAEYYFSKNYFAEAAELYDTLLEQSTGNSELLQKRGYCAQKQSNYQEALDFYLKADLVESNNSWTIKKIAYCYRALENTEMALSYYQQAIELQPKNYALHISAGHCLLSLNKYEEALNTYFKVELESKKSERVWRPIAWSSFISLKLEQAQKYYAKILDNKPTPHDYINAGHAQLVAKNNKTALSHYQKAITGFDGDIDKFLSIFDEDMKHLLTYQLEESDLPILLDKLRYDLEK